MKVKTLEEALEFVHSAGICTLFSGKNCRRRVVDGLSGEPR